MKTIPPKKTKNKKTNPGMQMSLLLLLQCSKYVYRGCQVSYVLWYLRNTECFHIDTHSVSHHRVRQVTLGGVRSKYFALVIVFSARRMNHLRRNRWHETEQFGCVRVASEGVSARGQLPQVFFDSLPTMHRQTCDASLCLWLTIKCQKAFSNNF